MSIQKKSNIEEVIQKVLDGNCMLFLGSGFAHDAINLLDQHMPIGRGLADMLDEESQESSEGDLEDAADSFLEHFGEVALIQKLRNIFTVKEASESQRVICDCLWRRIYTTNYDNLVETIMAKKSKRIIPVTLSDEAQEYANKRDIVVHLNGSVYNLQSNSLSNEFKLTSASYLTNQFQNSSWHNIFNYDIKDCDLIIFIGFSLKYDLDIKKIIWEDSETSSKCVFIMAENENEQNQRKAGRYGSVFPVGLDTFAHKLERARAARPQVAIKLQRPYLCFRSPSVTNATVTKIPDAKVTDLFLYGIIDDTLLQKSSEYSDKLHYYINRDQISTVLRLLENGTRDILVHSDLGNGKTLFMRGLQYQLAKEGYHVYEYNKYYASFNDELERICSTGDSNTILIVENYYSNRNIIQAIKTFRTKQRLIVSERSVTNDLSYDWLREQMQRDFHEIDLNILSDDELWKCQAILENFGLWRNQSSLRDDQKFDFLKSKCKGSMKLILLEVIKSTDIRKRIEGSLKSVGSDNLVYQALVLMFVANLLEWNIDLDDVSYALGNTLKGNAAFRRNAVIREYVDFSSSEIKVKSSILSEVILTHIMDVNVVRETLVKAFKNFDKQARNPEYKRFMRDIQSYANLQRIFNKEEGDIFNNNIVIFYEDIRDCGSCASNPHYWLQYAIAKLGEQRYDVAKMYFDNAYTFAKRISWFDTYQIDNHYARYILENVIYTEDDAEFFKAFTEAHSILTDRNHHKDTKFYPFKVARIYLPFYRKFKDRMSKKEKAQFMKACEQINTLLKKYVNAIPSFRTKHEVREAADNLKEILSDK